MSVTSDYKKHPERPNRRWVSRRTHTIKLNSDNLEHAIVEAAQIIRAGGLVAFATETVYGLGANALDGQACARIYEAKQRALNDPLIVHVDAHETVETLIAKEWVGEIENSELRIQNSEEKVHASNLKPSILQTFRTLHTYFWPGPLTFVLPRGERIPALVSSGRDTVAIRMPRHSIAQALIQASGVPIAAPSANRFGHVSPTTAQHVLDDLDGRIDLVLDGGPTNIGVESTVLDLTSSPPRILRPGGITREQINEVLSGEILSVQHSALSNSEAMPAPGMLEKHYAPNARLIITSDIDDLLVHYSALITQSSALKGIGLLLMSQHIVRCQSLNAPTFVLGVSLEQVAQRLYAGLRTLDSAGVDVILTIAIPRDGLGEAIADRLQRASAK